MDIDHGPDYLEGRTSSIKEEAGRGVAHCRVLEEVLRCWGEGEEDCVLLDCEGGSHPTNRCALHYPIDALCTVACGKS